MKTLFAPLARTGGSLAALAAALAIALPAAPELVRLIPDQVALTRSFWLIRHEDDGRVARLNRFADLLVAGCRKEMQRLESLS